jgi:hypothetical protein
MLSNKMKTIPYLPIGLLLLLCFLNLYQGIITRPDPNFVMYIVFAIVYLTVGVLVISKIRFASWLGFIIPLAVLFIYPIMVDFKHLNPWSSGIMGAMDATIVLYFLYQLLMKI